MPPRDVSTDDYIVAWIPPVLLPHAQRGIDVSPEGCIVSLDDAPIGARDELRGQTSGD